MEIGYLGPGTKSDTMTVEAYTAMAERQKRREAFYRSLLRSSALLLLFAAAGCFYMISVKEHGDGPAVYPFFSGEPFDPRRMVKELFIISLLPTFSFALCFPFKGVPGRCCDTVLPAAAGALSGASSFGVISSYPAPVTAASLALAAPAMLFIVFVMLVYALIFAVCASYARCRRCGTVSGEDGGVCFSYYIMSVTALCACISARDILSCVIRFIFKG